MIGSQVGLIDKSDRDALALQTLQQEKVSNSTVAQGVSRVDGLNEPDHTLRQAMTQQIAHLNMQATDLREKAERLSPAILDTKLSELRGLPLWM